MIGTHVRSAASLGGNIALGRLKDLESDVITVFMGAGASVEVVNKFSNRSACADMDLMQHIMHWG